MRICAYILLMVLTLQSFYRSIMTVEYQIHLSEYLAKCINKDQPQLNCNGQCVLMKKIAEKESREEKRNLVAYDYSGHYLHNDYTVFTVCHPNEEMDGHLFIPYLIGYRFTHHTAVFRPPIS